MDSPEAAAIEWISALDVGITHREILASLPAWASKNIFEDKTFNAWLRGDSDFRVLWAHGLPGSGNTSCTAVVVNKLMQEIANKDTAVAYVYCGGPKAAELTAVTVLGAVCQQLASQTTAAGRPLPALLTKLHAELGASGDEAQLGIDELMLVLLALCEPFDRMFLCVDALDECPSDQRPMLLQKV